MQWSHPSVEGSPSCEGGRAGHGAVFFRRLPRGGGGHMRSDEAAAAAAASTSVGDGGGEVLFLSGAQRGDSCDVHQSSIDAIEVCCSADGRVHGLRWSNQAVWARVRLPSVRTATYAVVGRTVLAWGGTTQTHVPERSLHAINVDQRRCREVSAADQAWSDGRSGLLPAPRGGGLCENMGLGASLVLCGSGLGKDEDVLTPRLLRVQLPPL
jgi:hypothetical protein